MKATPERSKVVVKNLPPLLPEDAFISAIDAVFEGNYSSLRYVPGRQSAKGVRASRAYIYIKEPMLAYDLRAKFDGHTFVNERGQQYQCSVEYAPYQKSPKVTTKKDPREGTLEKDTAYQDFLERLEKDPFSLPGQKVEADESASSQPAQVSADGKRVSALMLYMQKKWAGTLDPSIDRSATSQKGKGRKGKEKPLQGSEQISEALQSKMAPPPGFASINMPPAGKQSSVQSSSKKPKQQKKEKQPNDAAPAEVKPVFSKDGAQSENSRLQSRRKKDRSSQGSSSHGKQDRAAGPASGSEARNQSSSGNVAPQEAPKIPRRLLKKEGHEEQPAESKPRSKKSGTGRGKTARNSEGADEEKRPTGKPVKAGYQPYTPKSRSAT